MTKNYIITKCYVYAISSKNGEKSIYIFHPEWKGIDVIEPVKHFNDKFIRTVEKMLIDKDIVNVELLTTYLDDGRLIFKNDSNGLIIAQIS